MIKVEVLGGDANSPLHAPCRRNTWCRASPGTLQDLLLEGISGQTLGEASQTIASSLTPLQTV